MDSFFYKVWPKTGKSCNLSVFLNMFGQIVCNFPTTITILVLILHVFLIISGHFHFLTKFDPKWFKWLRWLRLIGMMTASQRVTTGSTQQKTVSRETKVDFWPVFIVQGWFWDDFRVYGWILDKWKSFKL